MSRFVNDIADKVRHVRAARHGNPRKYHFRGNPLRRHDCHWPGCERQVPPAKWGCQEHWYKLPPDLRSRIWRAYRAGQEEWPSGASGGRGGDGHGRPSAGYLAVAREAQDWIEAHLARVPSADRRQPELDL